MNLKGILVILSGYFLTPNIIAGDMPTDGKLYYIKGADNKYFHFDANSGKILLGEVDKKTSFAVIQPIGNAAVVFLQLPNKQFMTAFPDKTIGVWDGAGGDQTFTLLSTKDGKYFLESSHGNY